MLFNSYEYILVFLPVTIALYLLFGRVSRSLAIGWLILASVVFYAWWRPVNLLIIGPSLAVNYAIGRALIGMMGNEAKARSRTVLLVLGVAFNVLFLAYFKYVNFLVSVADDLTGAGFVFHQVILPLGISFITFQKIAFLIDIAGGRIKSFTLREFLLFVMFFPQLIAGPIVHFPETIPQFQRGDGRFNGVLYATGITLFCFGLFKKVVLADSIAAQVTPIYAFAAAGDPVTLLQGWMAAIGFTLQIYFDFAGYSDMACGAALFFGVRLPLNFNSPLRATSIIDYWLRWHITLSRFLTAYVYNPIALRLVRRRMAQKLPMVTGRGSHFGAFFHVIAWPMLFTMLLSGIWHGAGYTFVLWGVMHGCYLIINHAWRQYGPQPAAAPRLGGAFWGFLLTFIAVIVSMVMFRAPSVASAGNIYHGMLGLHGLGLPGKVAHMLHWPAMQQIGGEVDMRTFATTTGYIVVLLAIALLMPNSAQMMQRYDPVLQTPKAPPLIAGTSRAIYWQPNLAWGAIIAVMAAISMIWLTGKSEFLYWQF
ncbi:MAG: MBOAT family O-acyltransferase [Amaricoccus sp.]